MAKGFPDGTLPVSLKGVYLGTLKDVAVDSSGQIITIIKGASGVNVAVDAGGQLLSILRGWDGSNYVNLLVDSDGKIISILQGYDGSTYRAIKVDDQGRMIARLTAKFNSTVKDVLVDTDGNLTLNIKAQDLSEIISRPKYGAAVNMATGANFLANDLNEFVTVSGRGVFYGGSLWIRSTGILDSSSLTIKVDGSYIPQHTFSDLARYSFIAYPRVPIAITCKNDIDFYYGFVYSYGITFESELILGFAEGDSETGDFEFRGCCALI